MSKEPSTKIINVEALYLRLPEVKEQADSGQDAVIVRIDTDAGVSGIGEVDSAPMAVKGMIEGPYCHSITTGLRETLLGEDPFRTEYLWHKMYHKNVYAGRRGLAGAAFAAAVPSSSTRPRRCHSARRPR